MGFRVRDLMQRVAPYRSDLDTGLVEFHLQEAARRVMKDTFLANVVQNTFYLPKNVDTVCFSGDINSWDTYNNQPNLNYVPTNSYLTGGNTNGISGNMMFLPASDALATVNPFQQDPVDILRISRLSIAELTSPAAGTGNFRGYFKTLPVATSWNMNDFAIMLSAGSTALSSTGNTIFFNAGDVMVWSSTAWSWFPSEGFQQIALLNGPSFKNNSLSPQWPLGNITGWSQQTGRMGYISTGIQITQQPTSQIVSAGQSVTFTVQASGNSPITYQWLLGGNPIGGATSNTFTIASPTIGQSGGVYSCQITNPDGTVNSAGATLTVAPQYFVTRQRAAALSPNQMFILYGPGDYPANTITVWNGSTETVFATLPAALIAAYVAGGLLDIGVDSTNLHAFAETLPGGVTTLVEYVLPIANPSAGWTLNHSYAGQSLPTFGSWDVRVAANGLAIAGFDYNSAAHEWYVISYTTLGGYLGTHGYYASADRSLVNISNGNFGGIVGYHDTAGVVISSSTLLSGLYASNNYNNSNMLLGTTTATVVYNDATGHLHIQGATWNPGTYALGSFSDKGNFSAKYVMSTPATIRPIQNQNNVSFIYLATQQSDGANAVVWNGTTLTEDLINTGGNWTCFGLPLKYLNGAGITVSGRAWSLSDGSILHSTYAFTNN